MHYESKIFKDQQEWLDFRKTYIGATESASLLNHGQWSSYFKLWHLKKGTIEDDFKNTKATDAGNDLENYVAQRFCDEYDCETELTTEYRYNDQLKLGCSTDHIVTKGVHANKLLETKISNSLMFKKWDSEPPVQYLIQAQHQLMFYPEISSCIICVLTDLYDIHIFDIERHDAVIKAIQEKSLEFWDSIESNTPPELDLEDTETVKKVYRFSTCEEINADIHQEELVMRMIYLKKIIKESDEEVKKIQAQLVASTTAQKVLLSGGGYLDMSITKASAGKIITDKMVGQILGARKEFRRCQVR